MQKFPCSVEVQGLTKRYGRRAAVDSLSFRLRRNGAGKSATPRMLMNLLDPTAGGAWLLGLGCRTHQCALMERIGYVSEAPALTG